MTELGTGLLLISIGILATEPWRWLGVSLSKGFNESSEIIKLARAISTALIAALVIRLLVSSPGDLANIPLIDKIITMIVALLIYIYRRDLLLAIFGSVIAFILLSWI